MKTLGSIGIGLLLIGSASYSQESPKLWDEERAVAEVDNALNRSEVRVILQDAQRQAHQSGRIVQQLQRDAQGKLKRFSTTVSKQFSDIYGLEFVEADPVLRSQLGLASGEGVVVVQVKPEGLADQAGVKRNDILVKLNNQAITGVDQVKEIIAKVGNKAIEVALIREGKPRRLSLVGPEHGTPDSTVTYWIGVPISPVDATLRSHLPALPANSGLIVDDVVADSPAAKGGIQKTDILLKCNETLLTTNEVLVEQIQKSEGKELKVELLRSGKAMTLTVIPQKRLTAWEGAVVDVQVSNDIIRQIEGVARGNLSIQRVRPSLSNTTPGGSVKIDDIAKNPYRVDVADVVLDPPDFRSIQAPIETKTDGIQYTTSLIDGVPVTTVVTGSTPGIEGEIKALSGKVDELRKVIDDLRKTINEMNTNPEAAKKNTKSQN